MQSQPQWKNSHRLLRAAVAWSRTRDSLTLSSGHGVIRDVPRKHCLMLFQQLVASVRERTSVALVEVVSNHLEQIMRQ